MFNNRTSKTRDKDDWETSRAIVEMLRDKKSYPERPSEVECIETHISWVFLTDRYAYKLKKPVRYDFLDFSTLELRKSACQSEVRLNRRLAEDVYLDVTPITLDRQRQPRLGGSGQALDWVVKMRRLPANRSLDQLIQTNGLGSADVQRLSDTLTSFYRRLAPVTIAVDVYLRNFELRLKENHHQLMRDVHRLDNALVESLTEAQRCFLRLFPGLLADRVRDGRLVDGHGDLRPEHIYLDGNPRIIDCIEFNADLRQIDVLDELGFLAMECDRLGATWLGRHLAQSYCSSSSDQFDSQLWFFYKSYRACVRAKVMALRALQIPSKNRDFLLDEARQYLELAAQTTSHFSRPMLIVVRGAMGAGKSTLAHALAEALDIQWLQTDAIRRQIFGASERADEYGKGSYQPENRDRVYAKMFDEAGLLLSQGRRVILDGTFLTSRLCREAVQLANRHDALPLIVDCECPDNIARERIAARLAEGESLSEARPELQSRQRAKQESPPANIPVLRVDTTLLLPELLQQVLERLHQELSESDPSALHSRVRNSAHCA